jgi:hypothetical protein
MTNSTATKTEIISGGGFRIEIREDELSVTSDRSAYEPKKKSIARFSLTVLFYLLLAGYILIALLPKLTDENAWIFLLILIHSCPRQKFC